jgi:hypothetical protein
MGWGGGESTLTPRVFPCLCLHRSSNPFILVLPKDLACSCVRLHKLRKSPGNHKDQPLVHLVCLLTHHRCRGKRVVGMRIGWEEDDE